MVLILMYTPGTCWVDVVKYSHKIGLGSEVMAYVLTVGLMVVYVPTVGFRLQRVYIPVYAMTIGPLQWVLYSVVFATTIGLNYAAASLHPEGSHRFCLEPRHHGGGGYGGGVDSIPLS
jgi:hypothetical protein